MRIPRLSALLVTTGLAAAGLTGSFVAAQAAADPAQPGPIDGTVVLSSNAIAVGIGYEWGGGVLHYHGHQYHFSVKGLTVADVGLAKVRAHGRVYGLHKLSDFSGTYAAATGEATVGTGLGGQILKNGAGVELRLDQATKGARLTGAAGGVEIALTK